MPKCSKLTKNVTKWPKIWSNVIFRGVQISLHYFILWASYQDKPLLQYPKKSASSFILTTDVLEFEKSSSRGAHAITSWGPLLSHESSAPALAAGGKLSTKLPPGDSYTTMNMQNSCERASQWRIHWLKLSKMATNNKYDMMAQHDFIWWTLWPS